MPASELSPDKNRVKANDVILTENTDDFIIGDRVWVNGTKPGYIQYLGETRFGGGEWAGVVLDDHSGKNDGSVAGCRYFQCEPKRGVFSRLHKLTRFPISSGTGSPSPGRTGSPAGSHDRSGSSSPLLRCATPTRAPSPGARPPKVGERVLVNATGGVKAGVLRYLGTTDFAAGEWAGVELDEPTGKNDGTVAGKRYFVCSPKCGLFAPVYRVSKATGSAATMRKYHEGSHESLNSRSSAELVDPKPAVEQERPSSSTSQKDQQVHQQLEQLKREHRSYVEDSEKRTNRLRQLLEAAEAERKSLSLKLQEEKRKVEDLQFRVDEECISKDDLQAQTQREKDRIEKLEAKLQEEIKKNELLTTGQTLDTALDELVKKFREENRALRTQLREAQNQIQLLKKQDEKSSFSSRSADEEITRREEMLLQLQVSLDNKKREVNSLQSRIAELEKEVSNYRNRHEKHLETIDSLNVKLQKLESQRLSENDELHQNRRDLEESERRLKSVEDKCAELEKEKIAMRSQIEEALNHDRVSTSLNNQLKDKEKKLEEYERRLAEYLRMEHQMREQHQKELYSLTSDHREEVRKLQSRLQRMEKELEKEREKSLSLSETLSREKLEKDTLVNPSELQYLKEKLEESREKLKTKQMENDRLRTDVEEARRRSTFLEERCKRSEEEREEHVSMLKSEVNRLRLEFATHKEDLVKKLAETEYDTKLAQDLQQQIECQRKMLEDVHRRLRESQEEREQLHNELMSSKSTQMEHTEEMRSQNTALQQELDRIKERHREVVEDSEALKRNFEAVQILAEQRQQQIDAHQMELSQLRSELSDLEEARTRVPKQMENKIVELQVELAKLKQNHHGFDSEHKLVKTEKESLENQVDFLHSVIVDMQKKNDDLRNRLEILETEVIFDGQLQLGNNYPKALKCELCYAVGHHDTTDCPKQARSPVVNLEESELF